VRDRARQRVGHGAVLHGGHGPREHEPRLDLAGRVLELGEALEVARTDLPPEPRDAVRPAVDVVDVHRVPAGVVHEVERPVLLAVGVDRDEPARGDVAPAVADARLHDGDLALADQVLERPLHDGRYRARVGALLDELVALLRPQAAQLALHRLRVDRARAAVGVGRHAEPLHLRVALGRLKAARREERDVAALLREEEGGVRGREAGTDDADTLAAVEGVGVVGQRQRDGVVDRRPAVRAEARGDDHDLGLEDGRVVGQPDEPVVAPRRQLLRLEGELLDAERPPDRQRVLAEQVPGGGGRVVGLADRPGELPEGGRVVGHVDLPPRPHLPHRDRLDVARELPHGRLRVDDDDVLGVDPAPHQPEGDGDVGGTATDESDTSGRLDLDTHDYLFSSISTVPPGSVW
jgi:hypothetical protein